MAETDTWPEMYAHRTADPTSALPARGERVKVLNGFDRYAGQVGRVQRVQLDAGELLLTVRFEDGRVSQYWDDEVMLRP